MQSRLIVTQDYLYREVRKLSEKHEQIFPKSNGIREISFHTAATVGMVFAKYTLFYKSKVYKNNQAQNCLNLRIMQGSSFITTLNFLYLSYKTACRLTLSLSIQH